MSKTKTVLCIVCMLAAIAASPVIVGLLVVTVIPWLIWTTVRGK